MAKRKSSQEDSSDRKKPFEAEAGHFALQGQDISNPSKSALNLTAETGHFRVTPYVVLARKYRPQTFDDLIGQEAMVATLRNAFASGRIAHGFMLTGVRGVGKTTTARILARALNYETDAVKQPTIDMPGLGVHCGAIMEGRHLDVIEMDAASSTSVENIREVISNAQLRPAVARYKVFLIDEVHMLSKGAFNALLKTLEEPPGFTKFIFATTEIRKVPVTVLSRCQRFDLRRVEAPRLVQHLSAIVKKEGAAAEDDALAIIARAAEGSVRDSLSILDQAIATSLGSEGKGAITAEAIRAMLGLADRGRIFDLLEDMLAGRAGAAVEALGRLHRDGADAVQILADLAEAVHIASRIKAVGPEAAGEALAAEEKRRAGALGAKLSTGILARAWQMLLKGLEETAKAPSPLAAAEMVVIRIAFTADLPPPDAVIAALGGVQRTAGNGAPAPAGSEGARQDARSARVAPLAIAPADEPDADGSEAPTFDDTPLSGDEPPEAAPGPQIRSFADVVGLAEAKRDAKLKVHLEEHVSLVRFDPAAGAIDLFLLPEAPPEIANELRVKLGKWTGRRWIVMLSKARGARPIGEERREREALELASLKRHPAVAAVLETFPDAEIAAVRPLAGTRDDDTATG